jgi:hypothetical protein
VKVYISGPITGLPRDLSRRIFTDAHRELAEQGHDPVNPFDIPHPDGCGCLTPVDGQHAWPCCLRKDIRTLVDCDAIYMLDGWQRSHGARLELQTASALGLQVWWQPADPVFVEIAEELARAYAKFPDQHLPDGTGRPGSRTAADEARAACQANGAADDNWHDVLNEEVHEAFAETDPKALRAELVQVAAMAVRWIRDIDLREATP